MPTVLLDVDGVVADFSGGVRRELTSCPEAERPAGHERYYHHDQLSHARATTYEGMDAALEAWLWPRVAATPDWWFDLDPLLADAERGGARSALADIRRRADVIWATCRKSPEGGVLGAANQTRRWLARWDLDPHAAVVCCAGTVGKVRLAAATRAVAVLDDKPRTLRELHAHAIKHGHPLALFAPNWPYTAELPAERLPVPAALARIAALVAGDAGGA